MDGRLRSQPIKILQLNTFCQPGASYPATIKGEYMESYLKEKVILARKDSTLFREYADTLLHYADNIDSRNIKQIEEEIAYLTKRCLVVLVNRI